jgi:uncharacterized protein (TIGR02172 family)
MKTLGDPIAAGRVAEIFPWDETHILKLFRDWVDEGEALHEARMARIIYQLGAPAPQAGDILEVNQRMGLIYEKIPGVTMTGIVLNDVTQLKAMAGLMARLHHQIHAIPAGDKLPTLTEQLTNRLRNTAIPRQVRHKALQTLLRLPAGSSLCHGDFHTENIIVNGEKATVIDWPNAASGNPLADVARTSIVLMGAVHTILNPLTKTAVRWFHSAYLKNYFRNGPIPAEYLAWLPVIAAARLDENVEGQEEFLLKQAKKG